MMFNKLLRNPSGRSDLLTENSLKTKINQFDSNARLTPETFQNYSPAINSNKLSQYNNITKVSTIYFKNFKK